jgi:polynucleotide 5'-kinase involved in rRNA processing
MGIVRSADWRKRRLTILVPQESIQTLDGTRSLQFGLAKLDPDGTEKEE